MKRCLLIVLLLFGNLSLQEIKARSYPSVYEFSSRFELDSLDAANPVVLDNLEVLGRVWGFVKYHHPAMADTTIHIDYELFSLLPRVTHAKPSERNHILSEWIESFGPYEVMDSVDYAETLSKVDHMIVNDFGWIQDTCRLGAVLSRQLTDLRRAVAKSNRYVWNTPITIQFYDDPFVEIGKRREYDARFRLLMLFRLWNVIDCYSPNRNITDRAWDEVLVEYIPRMIREKDRFALTYLELLSTLDDAHVRTPLNIIFGTKPVLGKGHIIDGHLFITDPMGGDKLRVGDEILVTDGRSVSEMIELVRKYVAQSNENTLLRDAARYSLQGKGDSLRIEYIRDGERRQVTLPTWDNYRDYNARIPVKEPFRMLEDSIAYLYYASLTSEIAPHLFEQIKGTKALIVDLRCYPGDFFVLDKFFANYFMERPCVPVKLYVPYWWSPGIFFYEPSQSFGRSEQKEESLCYVENSDAYKGKVFILVNESTQSAAEFVTMHLQSIPGAITVGSQTAGADGDIVKVMMPGDLSFYFSSIKVLYPDGTDTQRVGVRVDYEVKPTIEGLHTGRDEVLEYALSLVD